MQEAFVGMMLHVCYKFQAEKFRRRRHELGMRVKGREFSDISDIQLHNVVREVLQSTPSAGLRLVQGSLRQQSLVVQRLRVLHSLRRVDPVASTLRNARQIIRRKYNVKAPNSLWHIDGNHKLIQPYRIVIHGGIDGYSRLLVFLQASTNNAAATVLNLFHSAVERYNLPSRWNNHPVSTECNFSPQQLWIRGMITQSSSSSTAVQDVVQPSILRIDEDGPVPEQQQQNYQVVVPQYSVNITVEQLYHIRREIQAVRDNNGITQYITALNIAYSIL
ncbi:PREDICTED: uncharacterized protein LOC107351207 isoform X2 [Paramuricea clavata]|uniref:PREDICTED: uncharacterized protein LOC107351207 isoform X2 n=1 Tax=Paramuricea clavata TaxID=317549 RepID=A0A6S7JGC7_PARCT|nr:PREDICTED: uncharacterized protein LOC107351207 isoform X2 [Paramuricea clavata]